MLELHHISDVMTTKHRKCYIAIKYILQLTGSDFPAKCIIIDIIKRINHYHVKTVALNHSAVCTDSSKDCVACILEMLNDLRNAYTNEYLKSFKSQTNLLAPNVRNKEQTSQMEAYYSEVIDRLFSVSKSDSCDTLILKLAEEMNINGHE